MTYISEMPYVVITPILLFLSSIIISRSSFLQIQLSRKGGSYLFALDGLRGFLAFGVFFHHGVITYFYYLNGMWKVPPSAFYTHLGELAVALFFMITGFLFWNKLLTEKSLDLKKFFVSRIKRIVPLYFFSVLCVFVVVMFLSGFQLNEEPTKLFTQIVRWFSFGALGQPDINGIKQSYIIESAYWTLKYEWMFYFVLPFLALFSDRSTLLIFILGSSLLLLHYFHPLNFFIHNFNFLMGMSASILTKAGNLNQFFDKKIYSVLSLIPLILIFFLFDTSYGIAQSLFAFIFFLSVVNGNNVFGLLTFKPARMLGMISYSIYLLHSIVLFAVFRVFHLTVTEITETTPFVFWSLIFFSAIIVLLASVSTYRFIEYQFYVSSAMKKKLEQKPSGFTKKAQFQ